MRCCYSSTMSFCKVTISSILVSTYIRLTWHMHCLLIARSRFYSAFREALLHYCGIMSFTFESCRETSFLQMITVNFNTRNVCPLTLLENDCSHYIAIFSARFLITNLVIGTLDFSIIFLLILPLPILHCASLFARFLLVMSRREDSPLYSHQWRYFASTKWREIISNCI